MLIVAQTTRTCHIKYDCLRLRAWVRLGGVCSKSRPWLPSMGSLRMTSAANPTFNQEPPLLWKLQQTPCLVPTMWTALPNGFRNIEADDPQWLLHLNRPVPHSKLRNIFRYVYFARNLCCSSGGFLSNVSVFRLTFFKFCTCLPVGSPLRAQGAKPTL